MACRVMTHREYRHAQGMSGFSEADIPNLTHPRQLLTLAGSADPRF